MMGYKVRAFTPIDWRTHEELVPAGHFYRHLDRALDLGFVRKLVAHTKALCGLGKTPKTTFLCEYLRLESLRQETHEGLQVIET